jgi:hypothetical protein
MSVYAEAKNSELLRSLYRNLARRAQRRAVTADDVHELLDRRGYSKNPTKRLRVIRSLLNESLFKPVGVFVPSSRAAARSRTIQTWALF